jgi:hypothetical protein
MADILSIRLAEIADQAKGLLGSVKRSGGRVINNDLDFDQVLNWKLKAKNALKNACGEDSHYLREFDDGMLSFLNNADALTRLLAVVEAAREDFDGGYIVTIRSLVQAEVFSTELEQASELLRSGYKVAAAVIAGIVLETALRELCGRNSIAPGKMDRMNADLAKKGIYNLFMQKRITSLAQIRNDAAHGKPDEFTEADVRSMVTDVERFLADHLR